MINLNDLHPQYITNEKGEKVSVVLSMQEFDAILEDIEDLAVIADRKEETTTAHDKFLEELRADGLL